MSGSRKAIVFSDMDGTLLHFSGWFEGNLAPIPAEEIEDVARRAEALDLPQPEQVCRSPDGRFTSAVYSYPPSTAGQGVMSLRTHELIAELRSRGVAFVIISGARESTLLERMPWLPRCDAYVCESGGLVFYDRACDKPDMAWAAHYADVTGPIRGDLPGHKDRQGTLWDLYRELLAAGFAIDTRSYSTAFRVDLQKTFKERKGDAMFAQLATHADWESRLHSICDPARLAAARVSCSVNLGKFDYYPAVAGKGNTCLYLRGRLGAAGCPTIAVFDDDNDLPMAAVADVSVLLGMRTESVRQAAANNPSWYTAPYMDEGVRATEAALEHILQTCPQ